MVDPLRAPVFFEQGDIEVPASDGLFPVPGGIDRKIEGGALVAGVRDDRPPGAARGYSDLLPVPQRDPARASPRRPGPGNVVPSRLRRLRRRAVASKPDNKKLLELLKGARP